jgi:hypothetical protein
VIWDSGARVTRDFFQKRRIISFQSRNEGQQKISSAASRHAGRKKPLPVRSGRGKNAPQSSRLSLAEKRGADLVFAAWIKAKK